MTNPTSLNFAVDSLIASAIERFNLPTKLVEALHYVLFPGGKRLRPVLTLLLAEELSVEAEILLGPAAALELLHTASLIHDDLPGIDNDDERRGKPSCHKAFGEGTAILAADFLISLAFVLATQHPRTPPAVTHELAHAFCLLNSGQVRDILPGEDFLTTQREKTGALFSAAATLPFLTRSDLIPSSAIARNFGEALGICFQLLDDAADGHESSAKKAATNRQTLLKTQTSRAIESFRQLESLEQSELKVALPRTRAFLSQILPGVEAIKSLA